MQLPVEPTITAAAFSCPYCGAYTSQKWSSLREYPLANNATPLTAKDMYDSFSAHFDQMTDAHKADLHLHIDRLKEGFIFTEETSFDSSRIQLSNIHLSQCFHCSKFAVWVGELLVFPARNFELAPNSDLPKDVQFDFNEARSIVNQSPRGAAALLRLAVQKLCKHLGEKGKNIDDDIGALVKKGLNPLVQQALDIVRVIGNEAVHPGTIDLNDDRETALHLFSLLNTIGDQMISNPNKIREIYNKLPEGKRKSIEKRDKTLQHKKDTAPSL